MLFRSFFLLSLALIPSTLGHNEDLKHDGNFVISEEFSVQHANEEDGHHFLRRHLQTCTTNEINAYACRGVGGGDSDPCKDSDATCPGEFPDGYPCSCGTCSYCQIRTANAILCQVTGARSTFVALGGTMTTCECTDVGGGQASQTCYQPSPPPIPLPTFSPVPAVTQPPIPTPAPSINLNVRVPDAALPAEQPGSLPAEPAFPVNVPKTSLRDELKLYTRVRNSDMP